MQFQAVIFPQRYHVVNRLIWYALAVMISLNLLDIAVEGLTLNIPSLAGFLLMMSACGAISIFYRYVRRNDALYFLGNAFNQGILASFTISTTNYLGARLNLPLIDHKLVTIDRFLDFNWLDYIHWFSLHPTISAIFSFAYVSASAQFAVLIMSLYYSHTAHGQRLIVSYLITGIITVTIATFFPAVAGYVYYNIDPATLSGMHPAAARIHEELFFELRNHSTTSIPFVGPGIATFPSFHSVMAILLMYGGLPFKRMRFLFIALNTAMLFSVLVDGGHWLTDLLGGLVVAALGIMIAERIQPSGSLFAKITRDSIPIPARQ